MKRPSSRDTGVSRDVGDRPGRGVVRAEGRGASRVDERGFGLVEALIAFVILSVGLLAIGGIALSVAAQTRGAAGTTARALAGQQVLEVAATSDFSEVTVGTTDTTMTVGNRSITVTRVVEQPSVGTKKVTVRIPDASGGSSEVMVTYLHRPKSAPHGPS